MSQAQKKAVLSHRKRLKASGLVRLEVQATETDAQLIKCLAKVLRNGKQAESVRTTLQKLLAEQEKPSLKALLAAAPLEDIELDRPRDFGRTVEL